MYYDEIPWIIVICMAQHVLRLLNNRNKQGKSLPPKATVTGGGTVDFSKKIKFGGYAQVWGGTTNTMKERSLGCIAIHALNEEDGNHFLSLTSG